MSWWKTWLLVTVTHIVQQKSLSFHLKELWSGHLIETLVAIGTMVW